MKKIEFTLNGEKRFVAMEANQTIADVLRYSVGLKSLKCGCERGDCGTCTIWINGKPIRSCLVLGPEVEGQHVTTLEGLMPNGELTQLQKMLYQDNAYQCGFCAPGMLMSLEHMMMEHKRNKTRPSEHDIKESIAGNLCRCTGYKMIVESVQKVVQEQGQDQNGGKP